MNDNSYSIESIKDEIFKIGSSMVKCTHHCPGVTNKPCKGILPRGLFLQTVGRDCNQPGIVVIGLRPGYAHEYEREIQFYKEHGQNYQKMLEWYEGPESPITGPHPYHRRLNDFIGKIEDEMSASIGPILWTERTKCQREHPTSFTPIPNETKKVCTRTYLGRELECIPKDWPIIIIGNQNYREIRKQLKKEFRGRRGLILPDPDKQVNEFELLFDMEGKLTQRTHDIVTKLYDINNNSFNYLFNKRPIAIKIGPVSERHYELFQDYIQNAERVMILNPFSKSPDQFYNIKEFCEKIRNKNPEIKIWLVNRIPKGDELKPGHQVPEREYEELQKKSQIIYCEIMDLHKRCIVTDTGWFIDTDRGFDIFNKKGGNEEYKFTIISYAKTDPGIFDRLLKEIENNMR